MTAHRPIRPTADHQRARGVLNITAKAAGPQASRLCDLRQQGSYRAIFPRPAAQALEAVIINTAGGVTGGDRFSTSAAALPDAALTLTTQAAERIYRAPDADCGQMTTSLEVHDNATLAWLPQETILFEGSRLQRRLVVEMAATSRFLMLEPLVFGREASGETLRSCTLTDRVSISMDGSPVYLDCNKITGDTTRILSGPAVANGARAMASLVLAAPMAAQYLDRARDLLPPTAGASALTENILIIRLLAADSFALRKALLPLMSLLTHNAVPKNWRL